MKFKGGVLKSNILCASYRNVYIYRLITRKHVTLFIIIKKLSVFYLYLYIL